MLPTSALPITSGTVLSLESGQSPVPQGPETAQFEAILAGLGEIPLEPAQIDPDLLETFLSDPCPSAALPEDGKDLPDAAIAGPDALLNPIALPVPPVPITPHAASAPLQPVLDRPSDPAAPAPLPIPVPATHQPLPRLAPGKVHPEYQAQPRATRFAPGQQITVAVAPPVVMPADPPRQAPPPRVAATLHLLAEASPRKAAPVSFDFEPAPPGSLAATQTLPLANLPQPPAATMHSTGPAQDLAHLPVQGPQDFGVLIERLIAARESGQPQALTLALAHTDFGRVELRFAHDGGDLSVAMASADPDFARAVQAAAPPIAATGESNAAQTRQHGHGGQAETPKRRTIAVIDENSRRRAAMTHTFSASAIHVEPFETIDELALSWPRAEAIMVEDTDECVAELVALMAENGRWLPIIAFAEEPTTDQIVKAVLAGAVDYLTWPCDAAQVIGALIGAESTGAALGSLKLREARARSRVQRLTRREREVLAGVAVGMSNRLIGEQLEISPRTVEIHRANMLTKMGAQHTSEAIRIAIEASLVA